jgi:urease accessory protein
VILVESGGDNLTATFSYGLIDRQIFVLDVAGGDKVARKGGPGVTRSDLLVVNKVDLAPLVGADVGRMLADAAAVREGRPVLATTVRSGEGVEAVSRWVMDVRQGPA